MNTFGLPLAYIDPGTVQTVFTGLTGILAAVGGALLVLLWPLRFVYHRAKARYRTFSRGGRAAAILIVFGMLVGSGVGCYALVASLFSTSQAVSAGAKGETVVRDRAAARFKRVMVLGMDGLDPRIMRQMIDAGEMPNFAKLAANGSFMPLESTIPPASPVAWSTMATGTDPGQHGIFDFIHRMPQSYLPYLALRNASGGLMGTKYKNARQREGFWYYTSLANVPTTVIRWPVSFPAEPVTGRFLSGFGVPDLVGGEGQYTHFTSGPVDEDDAGKSHIVRVDWDGKRTTTELKGPATGKERYATLPFTITRDGEEKVRVSTADDNFVDVTKDEWSDWLALEFSVGFARKVHGYIKCLLTEVEPNLRLTTSPIHMDPSRQPFPITAPARFGEELERELGRFHTLGMPEQIQPLTHNRYGYDAFLAECRAVHHERVQMLELELNRFDEGLLAFVFDTSDRLQHAFWATRDPDHPSYSESDAARYSHVIPDAYRDMDDVLGRVLDKIDENCALFVVSDHGFSSFRRAVHVNRWLIEHGYMHLKGDDQREGTELFRDVDWLRTKAYAYGFTSISLNLAGREKKGIVDANNEYDAVCDEIADGLRNWKDPDTGEQIVHEVYRATEIYPGAATARKGPDLILGLKPGFRYSWQTALGAAPVALIEDNVSRWTGDHLIDRSFVPGILFSNQKITVDDPRQADLCPTVLHCFGIAPQSHMTGRLLID